MINKINESLKKICWKLSGGDVANYTVNIEIFQNTKISDYGEVDSIKNILGKNVVEIEEIKKSNLPELLEITKECFEFSGDEGAHPNKNYLFTKEFELETNQVLKQIELLFSNNSEFFIFRVKNGHPFYPVFWDYAFLVRSDQNDFVFIGSSSD
jgi:hypothetical protein